MEKNFYREACIYNFISENPFEIENKKTNMLSIEILFNKYYNDEIIGVLKEEQENSLSLKKFYLSNYIKIFVDKDKLYKIVTDDEKLNKLGFKIDFEIINYYKYSSYSEDESNCNIKISKERFLEVLKNNINNFLKAKDINFKLNLPISYKKFYKV